MNEGAKTSDFHPSTLLELEYTEKFEMFDRSHCTKTL